MKTVSTPSQYMDDKIACVVDSLIFGHLQRKQYTKTFNALLSESPHLTRDVTTVSNAPNQIILNVNSFLHDQNLEQIIERFYTYGRFDVSPNLLELGKKLRSLTNEFSSELAFGCHSYSNNEQRLYGRKVRTRAQPTAMLVDQIPFTNQLNVNKRALPAEYTVEQVPQSVNLSHNGQADLQYSQDMESDETRADDLSSHEIAHHSRRKAAQPLKQSQRVMQYVEKMSNETLRDKESGVDNSSFNMESFLEVDNFNDIMKSVIGGTVDDMYETLESVEREEAYEADQNSRDSMNQSGGGAALALDIPMHDDVHPPSSSLISPLARPPPVSHPTSFSIPPPPTSSSQPHTVPNAMNNSVMSRPVEQCVQQPSMTMDSRVYNASHASVMPPPAPPHIPPMEPSRMEVVEPEKKPFRAQDMRDNAWSKSGSSPSQQKTRLPPPPVPPSSSLPPSTSNAFGTPRLSSLGRIPKKGQSVGPSVIPASPSASPRTVHAASAIESSKGPEGFRMSKGKVLPVNGNHERRDSVESQDTLRAESVGESDCTLTENEDNDHPVRREGSRTERRTNWDDLFEDSPSTVEESNREKERHKESQENRRRIEMKESEKKKERERRKKEKEKKEDERKDRVKDDRNRQEKRPVDDRRRDSMGREDKEEKKRRQQEEQKKIIDEQKKQMENEERARQMKKEEETRKREAREKEEEKKREKEREMKKIEDEKKEIKSKEDRRNELERRRRREAQLKKTAEKPPPMLVGASPLDKIAAEMDGKELKKENVIETTTRASSRVMDISSGIERNRRSSIVGSLHSSKSGIYLDKAQKLRDTTEKQPPEVRRPIRPSRVQMAPMKRPPASTVEDEESEDDDVESPVQKKGKLEDNKINNILNKLHR